jgi:hypothetical protein
VDHDGIILTANRRAIEVLRPGERRPEALGPRCCDLLCDPLSEQDGDPHDESCLVRRALATGRALPETRLGVDMGGVLSSIWITVAPIESGNSRVVVYLRPGHPAYGARRRRTARGVEVRAPSPRKLHIRTLGRTRVEEAGRDLGGDWLHQRPGQLLEYLLCARHQVATSEQISEALWPGAAQPWSNASLRHQVHAVREKLEPERDGDRPSRFIVTRRGGYMLDP